jgi:hypothetical protein
MVAPTILSTIRNSDFKGTPVILPDPLSPHWPIAGFKHLRPELKILLPKVTFDWLRR